MGDVERDDARESAFAALKDERLLAYVQIDSERLRQDERWGGATHDDKRRPSEWEDDVVAHAARLTDQGWAAADYRKRLVKIAALAVAAMESWDRRLAALGKD